MSDLTDLLSGGKKPINIKPTVPVQPVQPIPPATPNPTLPLQAPGYDLLQLNCSVCGVVLSVGKPSPKFEDKLALKCPNCGTDYVKRNYVVDSKSVFFHRPFKKEQQEQFDKEVDKLKKSLKVQIETLKTGNN